MKFAKRTLALLLAAAVWFPSCASEKQEETESEATA